MGDPMTEPFRVIEGTDADLLALPFSPCYLILRYGDIEHEDSRLRAHGTWLMRAEQWYAIRVAELDDDQEALARAWQDLFTYRYGWPEEWAEPEAVFPWMA